MIPLLFRNLQLLVSVEIDNIRQRLNQLAADHYPTTVASSLITQLLEDLAKQEKDIEQIISEYPADPKGAGDRLRSEHRKLISKNLPYLASIENARTLKVPWSLVPGIESICSQLINDRELLTSALSEFNYRISWIPSPVSGATGLEKYIILEVPAVQQNNPFLHVLVGHELFHPILDPFFKSTQPNVVTRLRKPCEAYEKTLPDPGALFTKGRIDEIVETARRVWRRATEELMCDLGSAAIFGPASLLASILHATGSDLDEPPSLHGLYPPFRYRIRTILEYCFDQNPGKQSLSNLVLRLRDNSFQSLADLLEQCLDILRIETNAMTDMTKIKSNPLLDIAYNEVKNELPSAWSYIQKLTSPLPDTWNKTINEVPAHLRSLSLMVPPGEYFESETQPRLPSSLSAIAVSAWLEELRRLAPSSTTPPTSPPSLDEHQRSCRLFFKAFEDAELKRAFSRLI